MTDAAKQSEKIIDAKRNASNSVIMARAVLGDSELGRILSKYQGLPNTRETRRLMVDEVRLALRAHMRATMTGQIPRKVRPYDMRIWPCKRLHSFDAVIAHGPGGFMFDEHGDLILHTPDGSLITWNITRPDVDPFWEWDGNRDAPTLTPPMVITESLPDGGVREHWQGALTAGKLVPA